MVDVTGWYLNVKTPPRSYRIDIGYLAKSGKFYVLSRSNVVTTPRAGVSDIIDENWADLDNEKADKIYAMSGGFDPSSSSMELKQLLKKDYAGPLGLLQSLVLDQLDLFLAKAAILSSKLMPNLLFMALLILTRGLLFKVNL